MFYLITGHELMFVAEKTITDRAERSITYPASSVVLTRLIDWFDGRVNKVQLTETYLSEDPVKGAKDMNTFLKETRATPGSLINLSKRKDRVVFSRHQAAKKGMRSGVVVGHFLIPLPVPRQIARYIAVRVPDPKSHRTTIHVRVGEGSPYDSTPLYEEDEDFLIDIENRYKKLSTDFPFGKTLSAVAVGNRYTLADTSHPVVGIASKSPPATLRELTKMHARLTGIA